MVRPSGLDFRDYFRRQYPPLVAELDFILGDTDLARDVAQDAFVRQYASWFRLSKYDKPGAWVRRVALRIAFASRKKAFREVSLESAAGISTTDVDSGRSIDVRKAISQLTEAQRVAVVLHYYRDLRIADVSKAMGIKDSTVKVHLFNARKRLAELLVAYGPLNTNSE